MKAKKENSELSSRGHMSYSDGDPEMEDLQRLYSPEQIKKIWETTMPKIRASRRTPYLGKIMIFGTGGDINSGDSFKNLWEDDDSLH